MPKRFYLATRKDRSEQAEPLLQALKAQGWERTFEWTAQDEASTDGYADVAVKELAGVRKADVLIVLLPGGFGTHVEIGAALALGKPVILHAPDRNTLETPYPCIFHYHPAVKLLISEVLDVDAVVACMSQCGGLPRRQKHPP
jgi:nucleoside 2-deoxyribosyltransferase